MSMNIFERAARRQLRFKSSVGMLTTEDLFTLDLRHPRKPNLNAIGVGIMDELKAIGTNEFDLVDDVKPNERKDELDLQLEIVKHIIESKKADALAAQTRMDKAAKRQKLSELLANKQDEALKGMSQEEILAELAKLDA